MVIMPQRPAEESSTADLANLSRIVKGRLLRRPRPGSGQRLIPKPLVRPMCVEEANVLLADVVEMAPSAKPSWTR